MLRYECSKSYDLSQSGALYGLLTRFDVKIVDHELDGFRKWYSYILYNIPFFSTTRRSYRSIGYITRSPHAQTKYGFHLGIKCTNVRLYVRLPSCTLLHRVLCRLQSYHGIKTVMVTFIDFGGYKSIYFDSMPQLDKSTCIVQIFPVMFFIVFILSVVWFGSFLYPYIFGHGRDFLYSLNYFVFCKFKIISSIFLLGGAIFYYGRCATYNTIPFKRTTIGICF